MRLIHFAHRGEASSLLKRKPFKAIQIPNIDLYESADELLLISGEGIFETLKKISFVSARYQISEVINLGIAGSLDKKLSLSEIYKVRTVYAYDSKPMFQSFEISDSGIDVISNFERVLTDESANTLSHFAQMVDRELWGLCFALKGQALKISSYKLISDRAGSATNCFDIQKMSEEYSEKLCDFYLSLIPSNKEISQEVFSLGHFESLYLTHQQRIQLTSLLQKLTLKEAKTVDEIYESTNINSLKENDKKPKELTTFVIEKLSESLNPFRAKTLKKLNDKTKSFEDIGARLHFDPSLEKKSFALNMQINSQANIDKLSETLSHFRFKDIEEILTGDIDV